MRSLAPTPLTEISDSTARRLPKETSVRSGRRRRPDDELRTRSWARFPAVTPSTTRRAEERTR